MQLLLAGSTLLTAVAAASRPSFLVPTIHDLQQQIEAARNPIQILSSPTYQEYNISVPVDHFHNESRYAPHSDEFFDLRYWFDASYYQPGGPVFLIAAGETDGADRLPFMSQGIVNALARAYHGLAVILEHRYYGTSFPVANLSTESLRFLSTDQAIADYAYFAKNIRVPGLEHLDLTAPTTPWIAYGGSYAGAFVAFLRQLYPDLYWGAVSTSGVTAAIVDYWEYMEPIRQFSPSTCVWSMQTLTDIVDNILINHSDNRTLKAQLKSAFGLREVRDDADFAQILTAGVNHFQSRSWDADISDPVFPWFCHNITSPDLLYPDTNERRSFVTELIEVAGYDGNNASLVNSMLNWIGFLNVSVITPYIEYAPEDKNISVLFSSPLTDLSLFSEITKDTRTLKDYGWISWAYQVCTEWGYFVTGSSVPKDIQPIISRLLDIPYTSQLCPLLFNITTPPDVEIINKRGGFNFSYPRLAIIDGQADPWRPATPHADVAPERESTDEEPFLLIDIPAAEVHDGIRGAVHHWDQNGLSEDEWNKGRLPPPQIMEIYKEVTRFIGVWLTHWQQANGIQSSADGSSQEQVVMDMRYEL